MAGISGHESSDNNNAWQQSRQYFSVNEVLLEILVEIGFKKYFQQYFYKLFGRLVVAGMCRHESSGTSAMHDNMQDNRIKDLTPTVFCFSNWQIIIFFYVDWHV